MAALSTEVAGSEVVLAGEQIDLFVESLVSAPLRDDRATMEFPFFALQKRPLLTPILYQDGNVSIRISPGERGIASIWDKDVLIYLSSLINAKIERGEEVSRTVRIAAYDMLRVTGGTPARTATRRSTTRCSASGRRPSPPTSSRAANARRAVSAGSTASAS